MAIGDWGTGSDEQFEVARAMDLYCGDVGGCEFIISLGDNFYGDRMLHSLYLCDILNV